MTRQSVEAFLERWSGWGRFVLTIVFLCGGMYKTVSYLAEQQTRSEMARQQERGEFREAITQLRTSVDGLRDQVTRLAASQERIAEHVTTSESDMKSRVERLERQADGGGQRH